jgi:ribose transport system substrate-binding protein
MTHRWKQWLAPGVAITAAALLAACSSSSSSSSSSAASSTTGAAPGSGSSSTASSGLAQAQKMVAQLESTTSQYPVPTASVSGVPGLKGRTVYYIPLDAHIPGFVVTAATMKVALAKAGLNFTECDGQGNPSAIASCVSQAQGAGAAGIVLDAIPYGMVQNALDSAKSKGVPIIIADQYPPAGTTNTDQVTYVPGVVNQPTQIAWWLIAASGGKASAIIGEEEDSPSSIKYVQNALPIFTQYCPSCHVVVKPITASMSDQQITASVTSNVQTDPGAQYYYTEFEDSLQDTVSGIQASGKGTSVGIAVAGGSVNGLGLLKSGQLVKAVVAVDQAYAGWALTDEILRMATKAAPVTETFPSRLFDSQNISSIQVTSAAQASGAWFGNSSYQTSFAKLWGV